ncbi:MAG TPA: hypothetical protein VJR23_03625 [Candidatus Acidoferrales bacterium]|nr:hypothetical protein [Candidatus Acidoferrales bacterium]
MPSSILQGGPDFTLTVLGGGFVTNSQVSWNGNPRTTTFVNSGTLQAQILSSDIANAGSADVNVFNPPPNGGSWDRTFTINPNSGPGYSLSIANQASIDLVWDAQNQVIYLSVPNTAATNSNSITVLNPATAQIVSSQPAGSNPDVLAISGDSGYLYVGLDGANSVQRFALPSLSPDINFTLGTDPNYFSTPYFALDLQVAPGAPRTTAVSLAIPDSSPAAVGGIVIYDDGTPRPTTAPGFGPTTNIYDTLQWGSDATSLYAANNEDSGLDFYALSVNATGVALENDYYGEFTQFGIRIHYDPGTNLVYSDDGLVVSPSTGAVVGSFNASGLMVPDSSIQSAFFLGQTASQFGTSNYTIESFGLSSFAPTGSITLPNVSGHPIKMIRWGQNGLAFNTDQGQIYLISGTFVAQARSITRTLTENVQKTWVVSRRSFMQIGTHLK